MNNYLKLYNESLTQKEESEIIDLIENEQIDESLLLTGIGAAIASGALFRIIDAIKGRKPTARQYISGILKWVFSEYENGSLSIQAIRKAAYSELANDKELEEIYGPSFSKILSRKLISALKGGATGLAKLIGQLIGQIAKSAGMTKTDIDKALKV